MNSKGMTVAPVGVERRAFHQELSSRNDRSGQPRWRQARIAVSGVREACEATSHTPAMRMSKKPTSAIQAPSCREIASMSGTARYLATFACPEPQGAAGIHSVPDSTAALARVSVGLRISYGFGVPRLRLSYGNAGENPQTRAKRPTSIPMFSVAFAHICCTLPAFANH